MKKLFLAISGAFASISAVNAQCAVCDVTYTNTDITRSFNTGQTFCINATDNDYDIGVSLLNSSSTIEICTDPEDTLHITSFANWSSQGLVKVNGNLVVDIASFAAGDRINFEIESGGYLRFEGSATLRNTGTGKYLTNKGTTVFEGNLTLNNGRTVTNGDGAEFLVKGNMTMESGSQFNNTGTVSANNWTLNGGSDVNTVGGIINIASTFTMSGGGGSTVKTGSTTSPPNCGAIIYGTTWNNFSGSVTEVSNVTSSGIPNNCAIALPIELAHFSGNYIEDYVKLSWSTFTEVNNDYFTIEKSKNGYDFSPLTEIKGAGNSNLVLDYDFIDENPFTNVTYYRLKQTDFDGQFDYSGVIAVHTGAKEALLFPNPASDQIFFSIDLSDESELLNLEIQDMMNVKKEIDFVSTGSGNYTINTSNLTPGLYVLTASLTGKRVVFPFVIQR